MNGSNCNELLAPLTAHVTGQAASTAQGKTRRALRRHSSEPTPSICDTLGENTTMGGRTHDWCQRRVLGDANTKCNPFSDFVEDVKADIAEYHWRLACPRVESSTDEARRLSDNDVEARYPRHDIAPGTGAERLTFENTQETSFSTSSKNVASTRKLSSDVATVLVILKSFTGSTLLVAPFAFKNGLLTCNICFWAVGMLELWCMVKLIQAHRLFGGSFGQLTGRALGPMGIVAVETSVVLSQLGFTAAEMIYVARNGACTLSWLRNRVPFLAPVLGGMTLAELQNGLTWLQLAFVIPISWFRDLGALTFFNFIGNALVIGSTVALFCITTSGMISEGIADDVSLSLPFGEALSFLGFSVYTFEGVNMVIPMYETHANKERFVPLLICTIVVISLMFSIFATANVLLYGEALKPVLTMNMPINSSIAGWVPAAFTIASLVLVPLMAWPTYEILEGFAAKCCGALVSDRNRVNAFRTALIVMCAVCARVGGSRLNEFLALVGAVGCMPLALVYPALVHLRLVARSNTERILDCAVVTFGTVMTVATTISVCSSLKS